MERFSEGDRIRIDIPDETDLDHREYHGRHGRIVAVLSDEADVVTDDPRDAQPYRVAFDTGEETDFRWHDLRPPIEDSEEA